MLETTNRVVLVLGILQITLLTPLDPGTGGLLVVRVAHALFSSRVRSVVSATFAANVTGQMHGHGGPASVQSGM